MGQLNELQGKDNACELINKSASKVRSMQMCGLYYPTAFHFPYAFSRALKAGVSCLEKKKVSVLNYVLSSQQPDGSFFKVTRGQKWKGKLLGAINSFEPKEKRLPEIAQKESNQTIELVDSELAEDEVIQATIYALGTIINLDKDLSLPNHKAAFEKGLQYLMERISIHGNGTASISGGTFFAGGTLVRGSLSWKSRAYSSALLAQMMGQYLVTMK
jgi:hypothetical protein